MTTAASSKKRDVVKKLLARASSRKPNDTKKRWTEVEIVKIGRSEFLVREIGRSEVPGEVDRVRERSCTTGEAVFAALMEGKAEGAGLSRTALEAVRDAADADSRFDALVAPLLPRNLTRVDYLPRNTRKKHNDGDGERVYVIEATGELQKSERPLRFMGRAIGYGTSEGEKDRWIDCELYRLVDGRYLGVKDQIERVHDGGDPVIIRREYELAPTGAEVLRALTPPGLGWVSSAVLNAFEDARKACATLDDEIGPSEPTQQWAENVIGPGEVLLYDARYDVLEYLEADDTLLFSFDGLNGPIVLGFVSPNNAVEPPPIEPGLFLSLSRKGFIRRDRDAEARGAFRQLPADVVNRIVAASAQQNVAAWRISDDGRAALERARDGEEA